MRCRMLVAVLPLAFFLLAACPLEARGIKIGTPGPDDGPQLVTAEPDPVIRIPVGHQHAATGCFGYLYFSRKSIRYEVLHPDRDKVHAFEQPLSNLTVARTWTFLGSEMFAAEFKFKDGSVYHFYRVKKKLMEAPNEKFGWDDILPWDLLVDAATKFDAVLAQIQANQTLVAAATKATAPALPPIDDSTAMDSAGLDVPPPPPWSRPVAAPTNAAGSGRP